MIWVNMKYLVVGHSVTTASWRALALGLKACPFPSGWVKVPEVIVVVESTLFG